MKVELSRLWKKVLVAGAAVVLVAWAVSTPTSVYAGGTIKADDDKWISIGMGIRTSFNAIENGSANRHEYSNDFKVDNARIYINGSIHKYVKFTFNTDCFNCNVGAGTGFGGNSSIGLLDAIGKFEFDEKFNIWVGRTLMPSERGELNGPFYQATYDGFRTPFFPADQSGNFPGNAASNGAGNGGLYGRDNGAVFFGKFHPFGTHLLYAAAVSTGVRGGPNQGSSLMYTGRLQWNFLNDEDNPGYYTSGTYYGTAGDIVAIAGNVQHQKDGAGSPTAGTSDFTGLSVDLLIEKLLPNNMGVFTFNGEFKRFFANYGLASAANGADSFRVFNGDSWSVNALYLIPQQVGIGRFQPYVRFVSIDPRYSAMRQEFEYGVNYIIAGHNARISAYGRYGDITTKSLVDYSPTAAGDKVDSFHVALQMQY
ncbi:MAG: OprO/OprP family phosphate-selective porin [Nitrospiraceae bacterium]|nr:OprO/OprP family phosphate-selective porin [Nitrospiraceae bacterium]